MYTGMVFLLLFCVSILHAQKIEKILRQYILVDTNQNLGGIGDTLYVMTGQGPSATTIGKAVIIKFQAGKTAARIVHGNMRPGYFVSRVSERDKDTIRKSFSDNKQYFNVQRVVSGYVLIGPNAPFDKKGKSLVVKRKTPFGYIDIGTVKVVKNQNGLVAAQVVNEINPYSIQKGDLVPGKNVAQSRDVLDVLNAEFSEDIDYYFFGPYHPD